MAVDVLVVEDDHDIRMVLCDVLADEGYRVAQASNGAEALKALREEGFEPKLILLDLMMPVMNGWQFVAARAEDARLSAIPVVLLSAVDDLARKAQGLNVDRFFRKPVELEPLLSVVADFCGSGK